MGDGIEIGGDELTTGVLVNAELSILNLVIVDVTVKANDDGTDIMVMIQSTPLVHVGLLSSIIWTTNVRYADEVELLRDADLTNDVDLLAGGLEVGLLEIGGCGEAGGEDFFGLGIQAEIEEFLKITRTTLCGIVGDEKYALAH